MPSRLLHILVRSLSHCPSRVTPRSIALAQFLAENPNAFVATARRLCGGGGSSRSSDSPPSPSPSVASSSSSNVRLTDAHYAFAEALLARCDALAALRYDCCPRLLDDSQFWGCYFYLLSVERSVRHEVRLRNEEAIAAADAVAEAKRRAALLAGSAATAADAVTNSNANDNTVTPQRGVRASASSTAAIVSGALVAGDAAAALLEGPSPVAMGCVDALSPEAYAMLQTPLPMRCATVGNGTNAPSGADAVDGLPTPSRAVFGVQEPCLACVAYNGDAITASPDARAVVDGGRLSHQPRATTMDEVAGREELLGASSASTSHAAEGEAEAATNAASAAGAVGWFEAAALLYKTAETRLTVVTNYLDDVLLAEEEEEEEGTHDGDDDAGHGGGGGESAPLTCALPHGAIRASPRVGSTQRCSTSTLFVIPSSSEDSDDDADAVVHVDDCTDHGKTVDNADSRGDGHGEEAKAAAAHSAYRRQMRFKARYGTFVGFLLTDAASSSSSPMPTGASTGASAPDRAAATAATDCVPATGAADDADLQQHAKRESGDSSTTCTSSRRQQIFANSPLFEELMRHSVTWSGAAWASPPPAGAADANTTEGAPGSAAASAGCRAVSLRSSSSLPRVEAAGTGAGRSAMVGAGVPVVVSMRSEAEVNAAFEGYF